MVAAVSKEGLGVLTVNDFLNVIIEDRKLLIRLVKLLEGLKQVY